MNTEPILIELFDRYLENDLNIQEMQDFELRLKNDEHFAESFRLHKEVDAALMQEDVMKFRVQLDKIGIRNSDLVNSVPMVV